MLEIPLENKLQQMTFAAGQSGNPGGRPKGVGVVRDLARKHTAAAINRLAEILENGQSEQAQIMAANSLLDRGWGRPTQPISGDDDMPAVKVDPRTALLDAIAFVAAASATGGGNSKADEGAG